MESIVFTPGKWQNLKRRAILFSAGIFLAMQSFSNPIVPPPMITEIHFDTSGEWSIELCFWGVYEGTLDDFRITGMHDTARFVPGFTVPGGAFIVTQDDFLTPLSIDPSGDVLYLEYFEGSSWILFDYFGIGFGALPPYFNSNVSAPAGEESIAWQGFIMYGGAMDYWVVKELPNTLGSDPLDVHIRAAFSGHVTDRNGEPLPGIYVKYCNSIYPTYPAMPQVFTDQDGYFHTDSMFCRKYDVLFMHEGDVIGNSVIFIEPDSANYFEFTLDTLLTGYAENQLQSQEYKIRAVPNPFSLKTTFFIESDRLLKTEKGILKIYNAGGVIMDILPVAITSEVEEVTYDPSLKGLAPGVYVYALELAGRRKASGMMIVEQ